MKPVALLIPGMLNDATVWDDVAPALTDVADVRIASLATQDSVSAMAAHAWALLDDLPPQARLVIAGFSLGGYVAIEMLARPARRVDAAALLSTSAQPEPPEGAARRRKAIAAMEADFAAAVDGIVQWNVHAPSPQLVARLKAMMRRVGAATAIRQTRAIMNRHDHRAALALLALPVRVLCGREDRVVPPARAEELAALIPGAQRQCIAGAGHMLPCEAPQAVAQALRSLLS